MSAETPSLLRRTVRAARRSSVAAGRSILDSAAALVAPRDARRAAQDPRSIFVLRNNDIGDLLVVTPIFEALRRRFPTAFIAPGVGRWATDVLRNNPFIDEVLEVNGPFFNKYTRRQNPFSCARWLATSPEVRAIRGRAFEAGIDVLGSSWGALLLAIAGIPLRVAVRGYAGGARAATRSVPFDPSEHVGRTALRLAQELGASELPEARPQLYLTTEETEAAHRMWQNGASTPRLRVLVGPGGGLASRCWPAESWSELLPRFVRHDRQVLLLGGRAETMLLERLEVAAPGVVRPREPPSLRLAFALAATADLLVCNTSMLMHVGAAFATPTLVLLGEDARSTLQHDRQWGYPDNYRALGKELPDTPRIASPMEAATAAEAMLTAGRAKAGDQASTASSSAAR